MRFLLAALGFTLLASAAHATPGAQALYVERRGLLEIDARCVLLAPATRTALEAGAAQAAGALLRDGWTRARLNQLETATAGAAAARACADPRNAEGVAAAEAGYQSWARTLAMEFPGLERGWLARRYPNAAGWRLSQALERRRGVFGVRERDGVQRLTLALPLAANDAPPAAAQMMMRDPARAGAEALDLRGRTAFGVAAGAPAPASASRYFANARTLGISNSGARYVVFEFPEAAFQRLLSLDPRESAEIRLDGVRAERILIEVGDIAAARAFLAAAIS